MRSGGGRVSGSLRNRGSPHEPRSAGVAGATSGFAGVLRGGYRPPVSVGRRSRRQRPRPSPVSDPTVSRATRDAVPVATEHDTDVSVERLCDRRRWSLAHRAFCRLVVLLQGRPDLAFVDAARSDLSASAELEGGPVVLSSSLSSQAVALVGPSWRMSRPLSKGSGSNLSIQGRIESGPCPGDGPPRHCGARRGGRSPRRRCRLRKLRHILRRQEGHRQFLQDRFQVHRALRRGLLREGRRIPDNERRPSDVEQQGWSAQGLPDEFRLHPDVRRSRRPAQLLNIRGVIAGSPTRWVIGLVPVLVWRE